MSHPGMRCKSEETCQAQDMSKDTSEGPPTTALERAGFARTRSRAKRRTATRARPAGSRRGYSHSIVAGGFELRSSATRLTPGISLMIRLEIVSSRSYGRRAQSAVIASSEVTARITIGYA